MSNIIKQLEQEQMKQDVPSFRPGDTVEVKVWVVEGSKKRLQAFEGVVIAIRNRGLHSAFTTATRRFSARPWAVLLLAMGYFFPKPCVVRLLRGICPPIAHASATTFARFNDKPSL